MITQKKMLTVGLASSALFNLSEGDRIFREQGVDAYAQYQLDNEEDILAPGIALPFIRRLLKLNDLATDEPLVKVILLSRNNINTGLRVMNSLEAYGIDISQAHFLQGGSPVEFIDVLGIDLFLSGHELDVRRVLSNGYAAGQCLESEYVDETDDNELRLAFDFDGVLADDESECVYQCSKNLAEFHSHEMINSGVAHNPGPLKSFLNKVYQIQQIEQTLAEENPNYNTRLNIALVTARTAPAHKRVINTMRAWNLHPNKAFFMGGAEKTAVLSQYKPHMFFDDQRVHLDRSSAVAPAVHVPFGKLNKLASERQIDRPKFVDASENKVLGERSNFYCA